MTKPGKGELTEADGGAAMMAWYADAIRRYPDGLVTQAQAAQMLGITRVAVGRLVGRGYLRAVYFPKPPDIVGMSIGHDDPFLIKLLGWIGPRDAYAFPKACFVSFADVLELWQSGEVHKKCARQWSIIFSLIDWPTHAGDKRMTDRMKKIQAEFRRQADDERELKRLRKLFAEGQDSDDNDTGARHCQQSLRFDPLSITEN